MDPQYELPKLKASLHLGKVRYSSTADPSEHGDVTLFDVKFYPYTLPGVDAVFAVCGGRNAIVYRCVSAQKPPIEVLAWFEDDAVSCTCLPTTQDCPCSRLHALEWSQASNGDPLLCVAGARRQIRIFNVATKQLVSSFIGHGRGILDLAVSPTDPTILASCSDDRSLRIWSLDPRHQHQPLAAICYGQGHQDQVLTMAYHRNGRYILSGGMDSRVNLWVVPENIKEYAGTDHPKQIVYPHFSTTEIHVDFVDCIRWYGDLILSRAAREDKIILWKIDEFNSENPAIPDPPIPTSNAIRSSTPVTVPANTTSNTRSAWGGRFQRLLEFEYPSVEHFYVRFSLFHELGRHPLLVAGNSNFEAYFWDLRRVEESGTGSPSQISCTQDQQIHLHQRIGGDNLSSAGSSLQTTKSTNNKKRSKTKQDRAYGISNPFKPIPAHVLVPPRNKLKETHFRNFSWSRDGQWCVGVGEWAKIMVYQRWEKGVPPIRGDEQATLPLR